MALMTLLPPKIGDQDDNVDKQIKFGHVGSVLVVPEVVNVDSLVYSVSGMMRMAGHGALYDCVVAKTSFPN